MSEVCRYCVDCTKKPECEKWSWKPATTCNDYDWNQRTITGIYQEKEELKTVEVRKSGKVGRELFWVADITGDSFSQGFVQPDGFCGKYVDYPTKAEAQAACNSFLMLKGLKTSAGNKDTNPKDIIGVKKAPISTLSCAVLFEMGLGMLEGARKYGRHNYRAMGVSASVYYDGAMRHLMDWFEGEDIDPDSGMNHLTKTLTCLMVLRDSMLMGNWVDDRPLRNPIKMQEKNAKAAEIIEKYPNAEEPYIETRKDTPRGG